ncbi:MAG: flippase [Patescibacteria group bacterium]
MIKKIEIAKNTLYQIVGKFFTASSTLLVTMLVTRTFGPEGYGDFMIMTTYPSFYWIMVDFGFNQIAVRKMRRSRQESVHIFSDLLFLRFFLSLFFFAIAWIVLRFLPYSVAVKQGASVNLLSLFFLSFFQSVCSLFQARLDYGLQLIAQIVGALSRLILVGLFVYLGFSTFYTVMGVLLSYFFQAFAGALLSRKFLTWADLKVNFPRAKKLFFTAIPVGLALVFNILDFKIDSLMLSILPLPEGMKNNAAVGFYSTAFKIFDVVLALPFFFVSSVYPVLISRYKESKEKARFLFSKAFRILLMLSLVCFIFGELFASLMIRVLAGGEFTAAVLPLRILFIGLPLFFSSSLLSHTVMVLDEQKKLPWIYGFATVVNVFLNFIFIPRYAYLAAAVITGVTELLIFVYLLRLVFRSKLFNRG